MYNFEITVQPKDENGSEPLTFTAANHDDILAIARRSQAKGRFEANEAAQLAIGFKLFSEVVLRHRKEPEFEAIREAIRQFVPVLKGMNGPKAEEQ